MDSHHFGPVMRKMVSFDDVIMFFPCFTNEQYGHFVAPVLIPSLVYLPYEWHQWFVTIELDRCSSDIQRLAITRTNLDLLSIPHIVRFESHYHVSFCTKLRHQYPIKCCFTIWFNFLWSSDAKWRHSSWSTLAQIMVWCLTIPSHHLYQYWLIISGAFWHSPLTTDLDRGS